MGKVRRPSARMAVSAQRFLARRMEHAVVRRDVSMDDDPMRAQRRALGVGCVLMAIAVAASAVLAFVRPQGNPSDGPILLARESGALYVRIGTVLHPVFNLASARLIAGANATPVVVSERVLAGVEKGARVGIPGAPASIGVALTQPQWTICDGERTVVSIGAPVPAMDSSDVVLVAPRGGPAADTYLLFDGWRARVDLRERAVVRALGLEGAEPQQVSPALLDTVPEVPAVSAPPIPAAGTPGPAPLRGIHVGSVVRVARAERDELFVVLADGVQRVGPLAADVIRYAHGGADEIVGVPPAVLAEVPVVRELPVDTFPNRAPSAGGAGFVCAQWHSEPAGAGRSNVTVLVGGSRNLGPVTPLGQADGAGPRIDGVVLPGGRSAYVRTAPSAGDDGTSGTRFLVTDAGTAFGIPDDDTAPHLGIGSSPTAAPWAIVGRLPIGPELSTAAASVVEATP